MTETCNAAVFHGNNQRLEIQRFTVPTPNSHEAIVQVELCTLCGSDLHTISGLRREPTPSILGHEILGTVVDVGNPPPTDIHGQPIGCGDRVTWSVCVSCSHCDRCRSGLPQKCRQLIKYGHEIAQGREALCGGLAEYVLLRAGTATIRLGPEASAKILCPANCSTATVAAAYRAAGAITGKRVLILGAGMLGLSAAAMGRSLQAASVTVCDPDPKRLELAKRFAADACVAFESEFQQFRQSLERATGTASFDVILEVSGSPDAVETACRLGDIVSAVILVGSVMESRPVQLDPQHIVRQCMSVHGIHNYAPQDLTTAVDFLSENASRFPFAELVERMYPLQEVNEAITFALNYRPIRIGILPRGTEA